MLNTDSDSHHSFLLRLWHGQYQGQPTWCSSLETIPAGHRWAFPDLDSLLTFLRTHTGSIEGLEMNSPRPEQLPLSAAPDPA